MSKKMKLRVDRTAGGRVDALADGRSARVLEQSIRDVNVAIRTVRAQLGKIAQDETKTRELEGYIAALKARRREKEDELVRLRAREASTRIGRAGTAAVRSDVAGKHPAESHTET